MLEHDVRQDARCHVDGQDGLRAVYDALGALEADEARADDEHALAPILAEHDVQLLGVVQRHEAGLVCDLIQPFHRRHERARTGGDAQLVIGNQRAVVHRDRLARGVNRGGRFAEQRGYAVFLVEVFLAVAEHLFLGGFAEQQIGNQRAAVDRVRFRGDQGDGAVLIDHTDALDHAGGGGAVSNDDVIHMVHLSS